jgi:PKHD-type hydroxylase
MLLAIPNVLAADEAAAFREALANAEWSDGRATAGYLSQRVKNNSQLREDHPLARQLGTRILDVLDRNQTFISAALPLKIVPPLFNRYQGGEVYGRHVDGGMRPVGGHRVRTDLSATLFLSPPDSYDGGELIVEDGAGERSFKLNAGDLLLYPATSVHRVTPVGSGERLAAFFWIQSMVRSGEQRALLYQLDNALRLLGRDVPDHPSLVEMMGVYHNLIRQWADS